MFATLLDFVNSALFHACFAYAVFLTLKASHSNKENDKVLPSPSSSSSSSSSTQLSNICIKPSTMKLWLMLSTLAALSLLGTDYLPLFQEFRVLVMLLIVFSSDIAQVRLYDTVFAPTLVRISQFWHSPQRKKIITRTLALLAVRGCIFGAIAIMNALQESNNNTATNKPCYNNNLKTDKGGISNNNEELMSITISPDVVKDVIGGLVFSQQALNKNTNKKVEKSNELEKEWQTENTDAKIENMSSTLHCAESEVKTGEHHDEVKISNVSNVCAPIKQHSKTEQTALPLKVNKPPLSQGRLEQWLTAHANVPPLRPTFGESNNIRGNGYAASGIIYANHEPTPMQHKQYAQSERYCMNNRGADHDVTSTTSSYFPGAWGAEWYYTDKAETLSATEEGVVRHRKRHYHRHTRPHARSNDREESIE